MVGLTTQPVQGNRKRPITVNDVPQLPRYLELENFMSVIPEGYEDIIQASINTTIPERPTIQIKFLRPETRGMDMVEIPQTLFNSQEAEVDVPMFLFERSSVSKARVEYFGKDSALRKNVNEMIYMILQHRLAAYARILEQDNNRRLYVNLLATDFRRLKTFIQHESPSTYNGELKVAHTYAVLSANVCQYASDLVIGEKITNAVPDEKCWKQFLNDVQGYVQTSSESSMSQRGKITLYPGQLYRSVGYAMSKDGLTTQWICKSAQNIPARQKTHILSDAHTLLNPATSCFQQDNLFANGVMSRKDDTLKEAIVVFRSMDPTTKRFVAGEIEASPNIASTLVKTSSSIEITFRSKLDISVEVNQEYFPEFKPFSIGLDYNDEEVFLYDIKSFIIKEIIPTGINGTYKLYFDAIMRTGNARIISNTGLKGVTKIKSYNGKAYMPSKSEDFVHLDPDLYQYITAGEYNSYRRVTSKDIPEDWNRIKIDLVLGMNAVKAKSNSIVLAQAALAVKYGYYTPVPKGVNGNYHGILDTLDVNEINDAANSLPEFIYTNEFGIPEKVYIGLAYIQYTELGSVYTEFKPQSFAFESGWGIKNNSEELFDHIRQNYLEEDKVAVAKDLYKILNDPNGLLRTVDNIPSYTVEKIRSTKMFHPRQDLFKNRTTIIRSKSKLLDPNWNPNGFYINLKPQKGPMIRVPSASTLNSFIRIMPNGETAYHEILFNISKIIQSILGYREEFFEDAKSTYNPNVGYIYTPNLNWIFDTQKRGYKRSYQYDLYMNSIRGTLYSTEDSKQMIVQSLIKPKIPGINMKQVVEPLLPDDVVVVMNPRLYNRVCKQAGHDSLLQPLSLTNIEIEELKQCDQSQKLRYTEMWQRVLDDVPLCLAIRNPSLWESQITRPRIWNTDHLEIWLKFKYNISLKHYLHKNYNRDIVLVSPEIALISHSDCDGDLLPMAVLNKVGQHLLRNFALKDMLKEEIQWNEEYWRDELETDKDLKLGQKHVYELFTISNQFDITGAKDKNYPQFLLNACVAKDNIGPATIDIWALKAVLQWYRYTTEQNNFQLKDANGNVTDNLVHKLNDHDMKYLPFVYTRLVQEQVIEGIKHIQGGSNKFNMYFLDNITSSDHIDVVQLELENKFGVSKPDIAKLLGIIAVADQHEDALKGIKNFITKFNKGKIPTDLEALKRWEVEIQASTYFGSLVKPLFDIYQQIKQLQNANLEKNLSFSQGNFLSANSPNTETQTVSVRSGLLDF